MALDNQWLKEQLQQMQLPYVVSLFAGSDKTCLVTSMGEGPDGEMQTLQLWLQPQDLQDEGEEISLLHIFIPICQYQSDYLPDIAGFLISANTGLDIPGFGLSTKDQYVYYRACTFITKGRAKEIFQAAVGVACSYVDGLTPSIKDISLGKKTPKQALQELAQEAKKA